MAKVFIDDSGSSDDEPIMWVAGWVGQPSAWGSFADNWDTTLHANNPAPIDYFKHYEARSQTNCFDGFSEVDADAKIVSLANTIIEHDIYGTVFCVGRKLLNGLIAEHSVKHVHQNLKDPFFICFNSLIGFVIGHEYAQYPNDKVDFIFDGKAGEPQARRLIGMFETAREMLPEPMPSLMGTAIPMSDLDVLPLQAADLLAGQARLESMLLAEGKEQPEPLSILKRHLPLWKKDIDEPIILSTIRFHNMAVATRRLSTIKREQESAERKRAKNEKGTIK